MPPLTPIWVIPIKSFFSRWGFSQPIYSLKISLKEISSPSLAQVFPLLFVLQIFCYPPSNILIYPSPINLSVEQEPGRGYYSELDFTFPPKKRKNTIWRLFSSSYKFEQSCPMIYCKHGQNLRRPIYLQKESKHNIDFFCIHWFSHQCSLLFVFLNSLPNDAQLNIDWKLKYHIIMIFGFQNLTRVHHWGGFFFGWHGKGCNARRD